MWCKSFVVLFLVYGNAHAVVLDAITSETVKRHSYVEGRIGWELWFHTTSLVIKVCLPKSCGGGDLDTRLVVDRTSILSNSPLYTSDNYVDDKSQRCWPVDKEFSEGTVYFEFMAADEQTRCVSWTTSGVAEVPSPSTFLSNPQLQVVSTYVGVDGVEPALHGTIQYNCSGCAPVVDECENSADGTVCSVGVCNNSKCTSVCSGEPWETASKGVSWTECDGTPSGQSCTASCAHGDGSYTADCVFGLWSHVTGECSALDCTGKPISFTGASPWGDECIGWANTRCVTSCLPGHDGPGYTSVCEAPHWTTPSGFCEMQCSGTPAEVSGASWESACDGTMSCGTSCSDGYTGSGYTSTCQHGRWSHPKGYCTAWATGSLHCYVREVVDDQASAMTTVTTSFTETAQQCAEAARSANTHYWQYDAQQNSCTTGDIAPGCCFVTPSTTFVHGFVSESRYCGDSSEPGWIFSTINHFQYCPASPVTDSMVNAEIQRCQEKHFGTGQPLFIVTLVDSSGTHWLRFYKPHVTFSRYVANGGPQDEWCAASSEEGPFTCGHELASPTVLPTGCGLSSVLDEGCELDNFHGSMLNDYGWLRLVHRCFTGDDDKLFVLMNVHMKCGGCPKTPPVVPGAHWSYCDEHTCVATCDEGTHAGLGYYSDCVSGSWTDPIGECYRYYVGGLFCDYLGVLDWQASIAECAATVMHSDRGFWQYNTQTQECHAGYTDVCCVPQLDATDVVYGGNINLDCDPTSGQDAVVGQLDVVLPGDSCPEEESYEGGSRKASDQAINQLIHNCMDGEPIFKVESWDGGNRYYKMTRLHGDVYKSGLLNFDDWCAATSEDGPYVCGASSLWDGDPTWCGLASLGDRGLGVYTGVGNGLHGMTPVTSGFAHGLDQVQIWLQCKRNAVRKWMIDVNRTTVSYQLSGPRQSNPPNLWYFGDLNSAEECGEACVQQYGCVSWTWMSPAAGGEIAEYALQCYGTDRDASLPQVGAYSSIQRVRVCPESPASDWNGVLGAALETPHCNETVYGTSCSTPCLSGWDGSGYISDCGYDGKWSPPVGECKEADDIAHWIELEAVTCSHAPMEGSSCDGAVDGSTLYDAQSVGRYQTESAIGPSEGVWIIVDAMQRVVVDRIGLWNWDGCWAWRNVSLQIEEAPDVWTTVFNFIAADSTKPNEYPIPTTASSQRFRIYMHSNGCSGFPAIIREIALHTSLPPLPPLPPGPICSSSSFGSIGSNSPSGTTVGTYSTTDPNDHPVTYTIAPENTAPFTITINGVVQTGQANIGPGEYDVVVVASNDQGGDTSCVLTITVTDNNSPPPQGPDCVGGTYCESTSSCLPWVMVDPFVCSTQCPGLPSHNFTVGDGGAINTRCVETSEKCNPNGWTEPGEDCDDGNTINGDGCDEHCRLEPGGVCLECSTPPMYDRSASGWMSTASFDKPIGETKQVGETGLQVNIILNHTGNGLTEIAIEQRPLNATTMPTVVDPFSLPSPGTRPCFNPVPTILPSQHDWTFAINPDLPCQVIWSTTIDVLDEELAAGCDREYDADGGTLKLLCTWWIRRYFYVGSESQQRTPSVSEYQIHSSLHLDANTEAIVSSNVHTSVAMLSTSVSATCLLTGRVSVFYDRSLYSLVGQGYGIRGTGDSVVSFTVTSVDKERGYVYIEANSIEKEIDGQFVLHLTLQPHDQQQDPTTVNYQLHIKGTCTEHLHETSLVAPTLWLLTTTVGVSSPEPLNGVLGTADRLYVLIPYYSLYSVVKLVLEKLNAYLLNEANQQQTDLITNGQFVVPTLANPNWTPSGELPEPVEAAFSMQLPVGSGQYMLIVELTYEFQIEDEATTTKHPKMHTQQVQQKSVQSSVHITVQPQESASLEAVGKGSVPHVTANHPTSAVVISGGIAVLCTSLVVGLAVMAYARNRKMQQQQPLTGATASLESELQL